MYCLILMFMGLCIINVFSNITNKMQHSIIFFIIVNAVHVSSGFSADHQELKTVHTALGTCQTCLLLPLAWSVPRSSCFTAGKVTQCPMYKRLGGSQGWSGWVHKILPPQVFNPQTIQSVALKLQKILN